MKTLLLVTCVAVLSGCLTPKALQDGKNAREMGIAYLSEGNDAFAVTELKKAVKHNRWDHESWHGLGLAYFAGGHHDLAEEAFNKALELNPEFTQATMNLGSLYLETGRWDEAITALTAVLEDPEYREPGRARHNLAWAHFNKGEYGPSRKGYRDVLREFPQFCPSLVGLGRVDEAEGKLSDALARYQQAVECNPTDLNSIALLGMVEARLDLVGDACLHLSTVKDGDPYGELSAQADEFLNMLDCASVSKL
ncbi:MAG: tetratricopeptide repeat protein [Proteobacteria bacterium]|nr:tetratricopeptide repeat protein [Pseudomonadota bacterium]